MEHIWEPRGGQACLEVRALGANTAAKPGTGVGGRPVCWDKEPEPDSGGNGEPQKALEQQEGMS